MTTLPLGTDAYNRRSAREPEVKVINRFMEKAPTNLREHIALIARFGTDTLTYFTPDTSEGKTRGYFSKIGMFNSDLFVVSGKNLWRYDGTTHTQIAGEIGLTGDPKVTWTVGDDFERLWITDGLILQYYGGPTAATGTLTDDGSATFSTSDRVVINGVYYGWNASVDTGDTDGTSANPFWADPGSDPMAAMALMLNGAGEPGVDYSTSVTTQNVDVFATSDTTTLDLEAREAGSDGNSITTTVSGTGLSFGEATLTGGGVHTLHGVEMPDGVGTSCLSSLNSYVLVGVANSQRFYFIEPGATEVEALNYFTKEAQPDPIIDILTVGDTLVLFGAGSIEFWAGQANSAAPFAQIAGRAMSRGIVAGTAVVINESLLVFVGNDKKVYTFGGGNGLAPISNHGIEERIRRQIRREQGLTT